MNQERFRRIRAVLERRQPDLTVVMENVHKAHNFSAVLRSCDAVGVFEAHAVVPQGGAPLHAHISAGSRRWLRVRRHADIETALGRLRERGFRILAAHPDEEARGFRDVDYTGATAVLLGAELDGLSARALEGADGRIAIPIVGMVGSLNVSVAAALILYEAQRQRHAAGTYRASRIPPDVFERTLFEWAYPRLARLCRRRAAPYPRLGDDGKILGPLPR